MTATPISSAHRGLSRRVAAATCIGIVAVVLGGFALVASADSPDPASLSKQVVDNHDGTWTVTMSGTWKWTTHTTDCNNDRFAVGWAMDWSDPDQPGNPVATIGTQDVAVGSLAANTLNPLDNTVHYYPDKPRCGVYANHGGSSYNTGNWGPISHVYSSDPSSYEICGVFYDVRYASAKTKNIPKTGDGGIIAGGVGHSKDNSVQENTSTPLGNGCFSEIPGTTTTTAACAETPATSAVLFEPQHSTTTVRSERTSTTTVRSEPTSTTAAPTTTSTTAAPTTTAPPVPCPTSTTEAPTTTTEAPTTTTEAPTTTVVEPTTTVVEPTTTVVEPTTTVVELTTTVVEPTTTLDPGTTTTTEGATVLGETTSRSTTVAGVTLPVTGAQLTLLMTIGSMLVAGGLVLVLSARRRMNAQG